jgi:hypothetical protein
VPWEVTPERRERLIWIRARGLKMSLPAAPLIVLLAILIDKTWTYVVFGLWATLWLASLASISIQIRRSR